MLTLGGVPLAVGGSSGKRGALLETAESGVEGCSPYAL